MKTLYPTLRLTVGAFLAALILLPLLSFAKTGEQLTTIRVSEDGYEPSKVVIYQNSTVVFLNEGNELHWPASNIHPTHSLYPESDIRKCGTDEEKSIFDACGGIEPGESYSFTFTEAGTWKFHDHLFPATGGEVVVMDSGGGTAASGKRESFAARLYGKARSLVATIKYALFPQALARDLAAVDMKKAALDDAQLQFWMRAAGYDAVLDELERDSYLGELDGMSITQCHTPAHYVGRMAYKLFGIEAFLGEVDSRCHFGFYHGTLEQSLGEHGADPESFLTDVCMENDDPVVRIFCKHGMGHGFLVSNNYDLPKTLAQCKMLSDFSARQLCYHGTFMENAFASPQIAQGVAHNTPWTSTDEPDFPCTYLRAEMNDAEITQQCYFGQSLLWGVPFPTFNANKVIARCKNVPEEARLMCFAGLGFSAGAPEAFLSNEKLIAICDKTPTRETRDHCLAGALFMRSTVWLSKQKFDNSVFCPLVGKEEGAACDAYFDTLLPWASARTN